MDEFRPEYVEALNTARWNYLWYITLAIPFILLIPAAVKRKFGCLAIPTAYSLTWLVFNLYIQNYWAAKKANAITDAEWADVTADTARVFAGVTTILYVVVYVSIVAVLIYSVTGALRYSLGKSKTAKPKGSKPKIEKPKTNKPKRQPPVRINPWTD